MYCVELGAAIIFVDVHMAVNVSTGGYLRLGPSFVTARGGYPQPGKIYQNKTRLPRVVSSGQESGMLGPVGKLCLGRLPSFFKF